jgi:hypothetical protein
MIKVPKKLGIEGTFFNRMKAVYITNLVSSN